MRRHVAQHRALDRADVGNRRAAEKMRADLGGDLAAGADRHADDDEIGAGDRGGIAVHHPIGDAEFGDAPARGGGPRRRHDLAHHPLRARRARDRRADQANADQRQAVVQRCGFRHSITPVLAKNSLSAATTSRLASSVPTVMRSAFGSL